MGVSKLLKFKEYLNEAHDLSTREGVHKAGVERLTNAYIKHKVTRKNYSDNVTMSPRKHRVMMDHEDKIQSHINNLKDVSKVRDSKGNKESEEMLHKIKHEALTKATEHHIKKYGYDD